MLRVFEQTLRLSYSKAARVMLFLQRRSTVLESSKKSDDEMGNIDIMLANLEQEDVNTFNDIEKLLHEGLFERRKTKQGTQVSITSPDPLSSM